MVLELSFKGLMVPVFTPFSRKTGEVDVSIINAYASYLLDMNLHGVLVNGTVGEGVCMSVQERKTVLEAWLEVTRNTSVHVMVQVGGPALRDVQELAKHAEEKGAKSILCLPDLFHRPKNVEELTHYLTLVGQAAPNTPLLYYHYPAHTGVTLDMAEFLKAAVTNVPTLAGIKFTHNNLEEGSRCLRINDGKFSVFLGNDYLISAGFFEGFDSMIATTLNILAPNIIAMCCNIKDVGNLKEARLMQLELNHIIDTITKYGKWVPTMKMAMQLLTGLDFGAAREPQGTLTDVEMSQMRCDLSLLLP